MSRALGKIYLLRVAFVGLWVALVAHASLSSTSTPVGVLVTLLLIAYPAADLVASVTDLRSDTTGRAAALQRVNATVDAAAVVLIALGASVSVTATMNAFAGWAMLSGALQLIVAGRRLGRLRGQWLMIISGAGSIYAGTTFVEWSRSAPAALNTLADYSIGGAVWYLLTAIWLLLPAARSITRFQEP